MLPNFMIVGAPKAGTTSLYHYLSEHPEVFMSDPKEVNFFSREEIEAQGLYYTDFKAKDMVAYKKLFTSAKGYKAVGEGSVSYLYYPETAKKIQSAIPNVKIIMMLRNPIERAFSHYLMDLRLGLVDVSFDDIVFKTSTDKKMTLYYQQYIELGLYYGQVKRYLDIFAQRQVRIYLQEDLRDKSDVLIRDLYAFLDVDTSYAPNTNREHNTFSMPKNKLMKLLYASSSLRTLVSDILPSRIKELLKGVTLEQKEKPVMSSKATERLWDLYQEDIQKLEELLHRDLSAWK